jgi:phage tail sheath gpL-like
MTTAEIELEAPDEKREALVPSARQVATAMVAGRKLNITGRARRSLRLAIDVGGQTVGVRIERGETAAQIAEHVTAAADQVKPEQGRPGPTAATNRAQRRAMSRGKRS